MLFHYPLWNECTVIEGFLTQAPDASDPSTALDSLSIIRPSVRVSTVNVDKALEA